MSAGQAGTAFLGLSHLGIVTSATWASFGQSTIALDPDAGVVDRLRGGDPVVYEPGLLDLLAKAGPHLAYDTDFRRLEGCPLVIVAQDVPTDAANVSDPTPMDRLVETAVPHLADGVTLVVMSQVPPGFMRQLGERIRGIRPSLQYTLYYWVETLVFGDAVNRALHPERMIVGAASPSADLAPAFRTGLERFNCPIHVMRYESAELTKTAINFYLAGSIAYANTMSDLCEQLGADWWEMVPALRLDARIGPAAYLRPGLGIAGGNLERDLVTLQGLAHSGERDATYLDAIVEYGRRRFQWVRQTLTANGLDRPGARLGMWGLTYKKNTRSTKNSPALRLIADLDRRVAISAYDPVLAPGDVETRAIVVARAEDAIEGADGLVVMADWDMFAAVDVDVFRQHLRQPIVVDCVGVLLPRAEELEGAGIHYVCMGR